MKMGFPFVLLKFPVWWCLSLRIPPSIFFPYGKLKANKVFWQFHRSFSLREIKLLAMDQTNQHDGDGAILFIYFFLKIHNREGH